MHLTFLTDAVGALPLDAVLDLAAETGVDGIELATGNWSSAPHVDLRRLTDDATARRELRAAIDDRGLQLVALNANGNQLHPVEGESHDRVVRDTLRLAAELEVPTVVLMSGLPAGAPDDRCPNWITTSWPPEAEAMLRYQWDDVALPYWNALAAEAAQLGVRLAVEMHGRQLVFNPTSFLRLRDALDHEVTANLDPSHLMWQGCDIVAVVESLGASIGHVHAKDVRIEPRRSAVDGLLDPLPPSAWQARTWNYVTLGNGHVGGGEFWREFVYALHRVGFDGALSVEHEDVLVGGEEGLRRAVSILQPLLFHDAPDWVPADV